ncbi:hypothetical protein DB346_20635 [Verrucomicrobia bacterium LW23]|nr:hypothetical protein DB346_20635 [Verrucomicrobia bacterium LW23]
MPPSPSFVKRLFTLDKAWKVVLLLLFVFCAGGFCGAAIVGRIVQNAAQRALNPALQTDLVLSRLKSQLKLSDQQIGEIRPILAKMLGNLQRTLDDTREKSRAEIGSGLLELNEKLTPEQQEALMKRLQTWQKRVQAFRDRVSPGP